MRDRGGCEACHCRDGIGGRTAAVGAHGNYALGFRVAVDFTSSGFRGPCGEVVVGCEELFDDLVADLAVKERGGLICRRVEAELAERGIDHACSWTGVPVVHGVYSSHGVWWDEACGCDTADGDAYLESCWMVEE